MVWLSVTLAKLLAIIVAVEAGALKCLIKVEGPGFESSYQLLSEKFENKLGAQFQKTGALMKKSSQINGRPFSWKDFSIVLNIDILKPLKSKKIWENLDSN